MGNFKLKRAMIISLLSLGCANFVFASVVTYPIPSGMTASTVYKVFADGKPVDVYACQSAQNGAYQFAYFDFSDSVTVKVVSSSLVSGSKILPESYGIAKHLSKDTLIFVLRSYQTVTVTPGACNRALHIFTNPIETNAPGSGDPDVLYYGPGMQTATVNVGSNQTLYIAGGAVISGNVRVNGSNITIRGRGIIEGTLRTSAGSSKVRIQNIIMKGSTGWTIVPTGSDSVTISNARVCNGQQPNEDGIDIVNSTHVYIHDCFIRTDDDNIAIKGQDATRHCSDILAENCQLWTDRARNIMIGFESEIVDRSFHDMTFRNIEVLFSPSNDATSDYWGLSVFFLQPCDLTGIERVVVENVNVNGSPCLLNHLVRILPDLRTGWGWNGTEQGKYVKNCVFRNIAVKGTGSATSGLPDFYILGVAADHYVDSISFENVTRYGTCVQRTSPGVTIGNFTSHITFGCAQSGSLPQVIKKAESLPEINVRTSGNRIEIAFPIAGEYRVSLTKANGIKVMDDAVVNGAEALLSLNKISSGIYMIKAQSARNRYNISFAIAR
jgi:hypothetical protein